MDNTTQTTLTPEEISALTALLAKLQPGLLPLPVFLEIARINVLSIVEIVPLRMHEGKVQILLLQRGADDKHWPSMMHFPGVVVLANDELGSYLSAFRRIVHNELADVELAGSPHYFQTYFRKTRRGAENSTVFYVEVAGEPTVGQFYDINALPANLVPDEAGVIQGAARAFRDSQRSAQTV